MQNIKDIITILAPTITVLAGWFVSGRYKQRRDAADANQQHWKALLDEQRKTIHEKDCEIERLKKERDAYEAMLLRKENNDARKQ